MRSGGAPPGKRSRRAGRARRGLSHSHQTLSILTAVWEAAGYPWSVRLKALLPMKGQPLPIFGDGSAGRDYTYIDDIVAGVLAAFDYQPHADAGVPFEVFNLGNSRPLKLAELVELLEHLTGHKAIREQKPLQPGDVPLTWADISRASRLLGYKPTVEFEEGLRRFIAWYRAGRQT